MEVKGTIVVKMTNGKSFKLSNNTFYTVDEKVIPYLAKINKGDEVVLEVLKKGTFNLVTKLTKVEAEKVVERTSEATGFICEVCGKVLKDGKYKKCYTCNQKQEEPANTGSDKRNKTYPSVDDRTAQIQRGNSLNAAAAVAGGSAFSDPETAKQFTLELADRFLEWLRAE